MLAAEFSPQLTFESMPFGEPFDEFVFKTNSLCNLQPEIKNGVFVGGCDYVPPDQATATGEHGCYEYADGVSWLGQPAKMSREVILQGAIRVGEHAYSRGLQQVRIIKHGGEPLLDSPDDLEFFSRTVTDTIKRVSPDTEVVLLIQTNGIPLTEQKAKILKKYNYRVGLSLDGDKTANDRHRTDRRGKSTYTKVTRAAEIMHNYDLNWGILAVIDTDNDPVVTAESLASLGPKRLKFVPAHANHSVPPPSGSMSLGQWQSRIFDWYLARPDRSLEMPMLDDYVDVIVGGAAGNTQESIGNRVTRELFILPNGYYQRVDTLKSTEQGAVATGMNIFEHSLDDVGRRDTGIIARRLGAAALPEACLSCPFLNPCGGGYYPHRFKALRHRLKTRDPIGEYREAFYNPTVYCVSQKEFLGHATEKLEQELQLESGSLLSSQRLEVTPSPTEWFEITTPNLEDVEQIAVVIRLAQEKSDLQLVPDFMAGPGALERLLENNNPNDQHTADYWRARIAGAQPDKANATLFVARDRYRHGVVIGVIEVINPKEYHGFSSYANPMDAPHDTLSLYVHPDYQSHGVGSALLQSGLTLPKQNMFISARPGSKAIGFFERNGFRQQSWPVRGLVQKVAMAYEPNLPVQRRRPVKTLSKEAVSDFLICKPTLVDVAGMVAVQAAAFQGYANVNTHTDPHDLQAFVNESDFQERKYVEWRDLVTKIIQNQTRPDPEFAHSLYIARHKESNDVVGFCYGERPSRPKVHKTQTAWIDRVSHIKALFVDPAFQRLGVATTLHAKVMSELGHTVVLSVTTGATAQKFYQANRYENVYPLLVPTPAQPKKFGVHLPQTIMVCENPHWRWTPSWRENEPANLSRLQRILVG